MSAGKRMGVSAMAVLVSLVGCELVARVVFPAPPDPARQPQIVFQYDPEIRYVPIPNQHGWVDDGFVNTNSLGFRGREIAVPKPKGRVRVVAVGDSVTFGFGVNDNETFCSQVEQLLKASTPGVDIEVLNLAVPGYDTRQEIGLLKRNVSALQPDLVLVGFYTNDVPDALTEKDSLTAGGTTIATAHPAAGQVLRMNPAPVSWWDRQLRKSRAIYVGGHALKGLIRRGEGKAGSSLELDLLENRNSPELETAWARISSQLADLKAVATAFDFRVGLIVLPPREQVTGRFLDSQYQRRVQAIAATLGFFVIDPLPMLVASPARKDMLFVPYDRNHPSAMGHRLIAESIAGYLDHHSETAGIAKRVARSERSR